MEDVFGLIKSKIIKITLDKINKVAYNSKYALGINDI